MKAKQQILIVEDEMVTAEDLQRTLMNLGYAVPSIASSAREAIKEAEEKNPDLILMDIKLKGDGDGVQAAERIRARFDIPVIYITALSDDETVQRAKITEPFGYIHKPIEERELCTTIEMALYRHKMERKLKESEERYRTLFEQSRDTLFTTTREGKVVGFNMSMLELFGYTREEMQVADMLKMHVNPVDWEKFQEEIEQKRFVRDYEIKLRNKNGSEIDCLLTANVQRAKDGSIVGYQGSIRDISERKKAEEEKEMLQAQLIQSEKMAGIGTLAGGIAHEFNNLLQIMRGHVQFAQKTKKPEDIEEALDIVINTSDRFAKIVKDLLIFSTQETFEKESCNITEPIESVLSLTEEHLQKQNIEVVRKYERSPQIAVNKADMQQVFLHAVTNARDAMLHKGGKLEISVKLVEENVEVSFTDTGIGMERENLDKVFEPFYTTKGPVGESDLPGIGIGLSVSYGIVKRHGGTIEVKSEPGKGTTLTIKLPIKHEKVKEGSEKKKMLKSEVLDILIVDDEEKIRTMFTKFLSAEGYKVKVVATGRKAINLARKEHFDLVFLDIVMPGIPAAEVLEKIKEISPKTRVVMITGKLIDKELSNELGQRGASAFLQKPFKIEDIKEIIG